MRLQDFILISLNYSPVLLDCITCSQIETRLIDSRFSESVFTMAIYYNYNVSVVMHLHDSVSLLKCAALPPSGKQEPEVNT